MLSCCTLPRPTQLLRPNASIPYTTPSYSPFLLRNPSVHFPRTPGSCVNHPPSQPQQRYISAPSSNTSPPSPALNLPTLPYLDPNLDNFLALTPSPRLPIHSTRKISHLYPWIKIEKRRGHEREQQGSMGEPISVCLFKVAKGGLRRHGVNVCERMRKQGRYESGLRFRRDDTR